VPLLVSSVTAASVSYFMLGNTVSFTSTIEPFNLANMPYYVVLGVCCGFGALYFTRATLAIENRLKKITNPFRRWIICAVGLGVLIFLFPPLYGEGYESLTLLLHSDSVNAAGNVLYESVASNVGFILLFFLAVFFFKVLSMSFTNSGGGVGGTFGPTLFVGGVAGFIVARLINLSGIHEVPEANFVLVGMAGMMSGVMHAPLTAIFLIAEITGGYGLFIPLILASATSFVTIRGFEKHSIYTKRLAMRGELITHNKDQAVLTMLSVDKLIETDFAIVSPDNTLGQLVKILARSRRNLFPVVDSMAKLVGVVLLDDIRGIMFDAGHYDDTRVRDVMQRPPDVVIKGENMQSVLNKFESSGAWNLPVVDDRDQYVGFVSKSKIFSSYRNMQQEMSNE
jgi:CIC family chloride channel protein